MGIDCHRHHCFIALQCIFFIYCAEIDAQLATILYVTNNMIHARASCALVVNFSC